MFEIVIVKGTDGVFSVQVVNNFDDKEKASWEQNGDKVIDRYTLDGSLHALGILVLDSLDHPDNFGSKVEELLTKIVSDIYAKKGDDDS